MLTYHKNTTRHYNHTERKKTTLIKHHFYFFSNRKNGEDHNTLIANNMGIIHFHVRHYAMAVRFFQHSLSFDQVATEAVDDTATTTTSIQQLHCVGASKRPEILYNLGVAMLHLQRPKEAFECLLVPLNYYHNNPRLWLRLAEACIMVHNHVSDTNFKYLLKHLCVFTFARIWSWKKIEISFRP